eukprot:TRINITY_DN1755_c0_g1_i1.p1 TRINITY_DN1755_c0_g1~~TRINITY_DN1755_c0_g1_i1.p1  ORF type:complete len:175 (+),score=52.54 TRINITY_DN1755_c0_g1_i1:102-626(+)
MKLLFIVVLCLVLCCAVDARKRKQPSRPSETLPSNALWFQEGSKAADVATLRADPNYNDYVNRRQPEVQKLVDAYEEHCRNNLVKNITDIGCLGTTKARLYGLPPVKKWFDLCAQWSTYWNTTGFSFLGLRDASCNREADILATSLALPEIEKAKASKTSICTCNKKYRKYKKY